MADLSPLDEFFSRCSKLFVVATEVGSGLQRQLSEDAHPKSRRDWKNVRHIIEPLRSNLQALNREAASLAASREIDAVCNQIIELERLVSPYLHPRPCNAAIIALPSFAAQLVTSLAHLKIVDAARAVHPVPQFHWPNRETAKSPNPKPRGRKRNREKERREAVLVVDWQRARDNGVYKADFAKQQNLTLKKFDNLLDRVAKRKVRSDK